MLKVDKFDDNLPEVINQINQLSYKTFSDLPRGKTDQKTNQKNNKKQSKTFSDLPRGKTNKKNNQKTNQGPSEISQRVKPIKAKALNDRVLCF